MAIQIKFEGQNNWTLRNVDPFDNNRTFHLLESMRKEGFTFRLATGEGPSGTFSAVKTAQLDELRLRMIAADVAEVRGDGKLVADARTGHLISAITMEVEYQAWRADRAMVGQPSGLSMVDTFTLRRIWFREIRGA